EPRDGILAGVGDDGRKSLTLQRLLNEAGQPLVVIDHKNGRGWYVTGHAGFRLLKSSRESQPGEDFGKPDIPARSRDLFCSAYFRHFDEGNVQAEVLDGFGEFVVVHRLDDVAVAAEF